MTFRDLFPKDHVASFWEIAQRLITKKYSAFTAFIEADINTELARVSNLTVLERGTIDVQTTFLGPNTIHGYFKSEKSTTFSTVQTMQTNCDPQ